MRVNLGIQTNLVAVLLITLFASSSFVQGTQNPTNEQIHRGNMKIGVGIGSVVAGLFLLTPAQNSAPRSEQNQNDVLAAGLVGSNVRLTEQEVEEAHYAISTHTKRADSNLDFRRGGRGNNCVVHLPESRARCAFRCGANGINYGPVETVLRRTLHWMNVQLWQRHEENGMDRCCHLDA
jgi:hypothetical protein